MEDVVVAAGGLTIRSGVVSWTAREGKGTLRTSSMWQQFSH